ncbi:alpha-hydroxy acid oxidase [Micromonospora endophytica]|uniref:Alpha-hydroxy-acid oxidizing enzyme n=1 Tax=Micromonospora endophytica TaxID=515350 RepID=A0A2W2DH48_9ACTN|nr:alpha-hydroxy acid oxidase [Micromonospora endophytica]PZF99137.1 alpha-hydroxy-acid oxidizing enzyme [Micromonospora endophytica]RIW48234.1 alpha-hydroxy-acid oxidizing protein [Micromonospora endophytica]BCJ56712.1 alpha-hydroxy-acid oxidizing enzyme [Micromonospora endophytica]
MESKVPVCLADFAQRARAVLPPEVWDYLDGGSGTEVTLEANRSALDRVGVLPRVLTGVATASLRTRLLGREYAMPVGVAPMAYQRLVHPDGEVGLANAARSADLPYLASILGSTPIEQVTATGAEVWFQLYWLRDRGLVTELLARVREAGCRALVVTVDVPVLGRRYRDLRNAFRLPPELVAANLPGGRDDLAHGGTPGVTAVSVTSGAAFAPALGWADLRWLAEHCELPLVVKGILDPADAARAVDAGARAVVVSNHGGRQLDGVPASATMLPEVVAAVGERCEVLLDSGVRGGLDVLRALALGAHGVLVGRPMLWALAAGGAAGASAGLALLADELRDALALAGCADPAAARTLRTVPLD